MITKTRSPLQVKAVSKSGEVEALIATLNVIDKHGDVTLPGFFGEQPASIVTSHDWNEVQIGKGEIMEDGEEVIFRGRFNLGADDGRNTHAKILFDMEDGAAKALIEWSYGYSILRGGWRFGEFEGEDVRFLTPITDENGGILSAGVDVHEVSPVLLGAGEGTGTLDVKTSRDGAPFAEQADAALAHVGALLERAEAIKALRKGERLGAVSMDTLKTLGVSLGELTGALDALVLEVPGEPDEPKAASSPHVELARFLSLTGSHLTP